MTQFTLIVDDFLDTIQAILISFLVKLGPFCVALMPAIFTGYSIYHTFKEAGEWLWLALLFAFVVGLAIETVGIIATHTTVNLYNGKNRGTVEPVKFTLMVWLIPVYVASVAGVVLFSKDAFTPLVKSLGVASPFLTCVVYIAVALHRDMVNLKAREEREASTQEQKEANEKAWQREQKRLQMEFRHEERMAKIRAKPERNNPQAQPHNPEHSAQNGSNRPPRQVPRALWRKAAREIFAQNPEISGAELGRLIGASERTGQNIMSEFSKNGSGE